MDMLQNFIDGRWIDAPERAPAVNPATGQQIAWLPKSDRAIACDAIAAGKRARAGGRGRRCGNAPRCAWPSRLRSTRAAHGSHARLTREQGKPLSQPTGEVAKAADGFQLAAELVRQMKGEMLPAEDPTKLVMTLRQPRGVYAVITPWNYPVNIPVEYLGPGLATGNTIVWVPAATTSMAAVELMRAIEAAGLPAGVLNLVIGEGPVIGDEIVSHPDTAGIGFTGSAAPASRCCSSSGAMALCSYSRTPISSGPRRPDLGSELFFEPTVLTGVTREMRINREETFGPVTPILSFRDDNEAMSLALDSEYGLSVGVFTRDMDRALRFAEAIPAGIVNIDDSSTYWEIHLAFGGGSRTRSGVGRLGGRLTLEAMTEIKMITVTRAM
jgi:acyl-CoA reductase-like NAD-dependent aldehyde dehydrogenase